MPGNNLDQVMKLVGQNEEAVKILTEPSSHTNKPGHVNRPGHMLNSEYLQKMASEATVSGDDMTQEAFETASAASTMDIDDLPGADKPKVQFNKNIEVKSYDPQGTLDGFGLHGQTTGQQILISDSSQESSLEETSSNDHITTDVEEVNPHFPESKTTDFRISCGLTVFHTHKDKLMGISYFLQIMARGPGEGNSDTVDLSDFDPAVVEVILLHAYGAKYTLTVAKKCKRPSSRNIVEVLTDGMGTEGIMKMTVQEYYTPTGEMQRWRKTRNYHKAGIAIHKERHGVDRLVSTHFCKELYMHAGVHIAAQGLGWKELAERAGAHITRLLPDCWGSDSVLDTYILLLQHMDPDQRIDSNQPLLLHLAHKLSQQVSYFRFSQKFKDFLHSYPTFAQAMMLQYAELGFAHGPIDASAYCPQYTCRCNVQPVEKGWGKWKCSKCKEMVVLDAKTLVR